MFFKEFSAKTNFNQEVHKVFNLLLEKMVENEESEVLSKELKLSRFPLSNNAKKD
jgi:hypothetical protein